MEQSILNVMRNYMTNKGLLFKILLFIFIISFSGICYASKISEIMSEALKQRGNGNITAAIKGFKKAVEVAPSLLQKNLALFMLGDCQMEAKEYSDAIESFTELSKKATTAEERAEALYKIMEANSNLDNQEGVNKAYDEIKKKYPKSAYYKIAEAFVSAGELLDEYPENIIEEKQVVEQTKTESEETKEIVQKEEKNVKQQKKTEDKKVIAKVEQPKKQKETKSTTNQNTNKTNIPYSTDNKTSAILEEIINIEPASEDERDELVAKILSYQDELKSGEKGSGKDKVLFELAGATAKFGELLEACKTYDKILSLHPTSPYVEESYYQSIRLRAILGVHQAVIEWSKAFNIAFPKSRFKQKIAALVTYSKAGGKVQLSKDARASRKVSTDETNENNNIKNKKSSKNTAKKEVKEDSFAVDKANTALKETSLYKKATQKMNDGKYTEALDDLKVLASKFPDASQLWWDTTLIYIQLEEFRRADRSIRKMLLLEPENADANSLLGYIQYRLENYDEAASAYEQAGDSEGEGVTFFDAKTASKRMKKNASK